MDDPLARRLSWLTTIFCCFHVGWMAYHFGGWMSALKDVFAGLAFPLPATAAFAVSITRGESLIAGALVIAGLVAKELLIQRTVIRHVITFLTFMVVTWFAWFCLGGVYEVFFEIFRRIG